MKIQGVLLLMGFILFVGFIWGKAFEPAGPHNILESNIWDELFYSDNSDNRQQNYSATEIPIGEYDEMASVDVIRNGSDIWVVDHYTGALIFEYNRFKEADKEAWQEYGDLLGERK